jgi:hypothetical protein
VIPPINSRIEPLNLIPSCGVSKSLTTILLLHGGEGRDEGELYRVSLTISPKVHGEGESSRPESCSGSWKVSHILQIYVYLPIRYLKPGAPRLVPLSAPICE